MSTLSKTQIDRLGDRMRKGSISEADIKMLNDYRRSFGDAYEEVIKTLKNNLNLRPAGRPAKSTGSIIEKLHRETIRLSQVQDIAGCRIILKDIEEQDFTTELIKNIFPSMIVIDRRTKPSYGYRAVHAIIKINEKPIEVQIRTLIQHKWAELSEKLSDKINPLIKYGRGDKNSLKLLRNYSNLTQSYEKIERKILILKKNDPKNKEIKKLYSGILKIKKNIKKHLDQYIKEKVKL